MKLTKKDVAGLREYFNAPMRRMPDGIAALALKVRGAQIWQQTVNPHFREVELSPYMQVLLRSEEVVEECVRQVRGGKKVTFKEASLFAMPFGKHKGKPLYQVPLDYMDWLVGKMEEGKQANTRTYKAMVCYLRDPAVSKELDEVLMERRGR